VNRKSVATSPCPWIGAGSLTQLPRPPNDPNRRRRPGKRAAPTTVDTSRNWEGEGRGRKHAACAGGGILYRLASTGHNAFQPHRYMRGHTHR